MPDIFSKIIKDYNNELEKILEKKDFESNVKNLLLSMLYKIENGYDDYKKVKVNVCNKNEFVNEVIETIDRRCKKIEIINPASDEGQKLQEKNINCIIDKENGYIKTFQNEKSMLDAIIQIRQETIKLKPKYNDISTPIIEVLTQGNIMNSLELITDFNGWSWDITTINKKNDVYNKLYQTLIILIGNKTIDGWINRRKDDIEKIPSNLILSSKYNESFGITKKEIIGEEIDYIDRIKDEFEKIYGEELKERFFEVFLKNAILECTKHNESYKKEISEKIKSLNTSLKRMNNNKLYLEDLSKQKKGIIKQIEEIDILLSNKDKLKEEYDKRNAKLKNEEKIFSVSHLKLALEKKRNNKLQEIKDINKKMEPNEFVEFKRKLDKEVEFYNSINLEDTTKQNSIRLLKELQKVFFECFETKIKKSTENNQIEDLIYELRYYKLIMDKPNTDKLEKMIIDKAILQKILTKFSEEDKTNHLILKEMFISRIIDLDTIAFMLKFSKGIIIINIFDGTTGDETKQIKLTEKAELSVRLNKKIKLWQ